MFVVVVVLLVMVVVEMGEVVVVVVVYRGRSEARIRSRIEGEVGGVERPNVPAARSYPAVQERRRRHSDAHTPNQHWWHRSVCLSVCLPNKVHFHAIPLIQRDTFSSDYVSAVENGYCPQSKA